MSLTVWGNLEKSQIDPEKIEEAVARLIQAHEDDANAHIEIGESLYSHKASEIIDHIIASIIADKIKDFEVPLSKLNSDKYCLFPSFESLDAWQVLGTGTTSLELGYLFFYTQNVINTYVSIHTNNDELPGNFGEKNPSIEMNVRLWSTTSQKVYFGAGGYGIEFIGFKVMNGTLYACNAIGGSEYITEITGVDLTVLHTYRAVYTSGEKIEFYVDGVLKHTETTHLNEETDIPELLCLYIKTYVDSTRSMIVANIKYIQDK